MSAAAAAAEAELSQFRQRSRQFAGAATAVVAVIGVIIVLTLGVVVLRGQAMGWARVTRLALSWTPAVCYLWALWTLRGMFRALARDGLTFQPAVTRALGRVGWALAGGAVLTLLEAPVVVWLTGGGGPGGGFATLNVPALTLGVTGLALVVLAAMLRRGARLEAETTRLKAVLNDFI